MNGKRPYETGDPITHGAYFLYAALPIVRYRYSAHDPEDAVGYGEVLGFPNPPKGKPRAVYHYFNEEFGHVVVSFPSVDSAMHFEVTNQLMEVFRKKRRVPGYLEGRLELLGANLPWFYSMTTPKRR